MNKLISATLLGLLLLTNPSFAEKVEIETAKQIAINLYYEKANQNQSDISYNEISILQNYIEDYKGHTVYYAFDINNGGFVIISADDSYTPIIGYSFEGHFPRHEEGNYPFNSFMKSYAQKLDYSISNHNEASEEDRELWNYYTDPEFSMNIFSYREGDVAPLLTAMWNQDYPYNYYCPEDDDGPGDHVYAGCVATTMSVFMYYYRYPLTGEGSHTYTHDNYGTLSANFGETEYNYEAMNDEIQNYNPFQIALLQQHCGISIDMDYGPDGSGAYSQTAAVKLNENFRYTSGTLGLMGNYPIETWYDMIKEQLYANKIIPYRGNSEEFGHAFILDGFQGDNYYHFNFGWSGSANGYFTLSDVNGYNGENAAIFDCVPADPSYPYLAEGHKELLQSSGSFTDGSGPLYNYSNDMEASWLIDPTTQGDSIENISFFFTELDLDSGDTIQVFDGENEEATLLGAFSGSEIPESITSTNNKLYITFSSDENGNAKGFKAEYTSKFHKFCESLLTFTEPFDTISDGSGMYNYQNGAACGWTTNLPNSETITLHFLELDTEEDHDIIKVFEGTQVVATISGNVIPEPITINGGTMTVTFTTNGCVNSNGWKAYYTTDFVGINDIDDTDQIVVAPNPSNGKFSVILTMSDLNDYHIIEIYSIDGKLAYRNAINLTKSNNSITIDMAKAKKGIYFMRLKGERTSKTQKLIIN